MPLEVRHNVPKSISVPVVASWDCRQVHAPVGVPPSIQVPASATVLSVSSVFSVCTPIFSYNPAQAHSTTSRVHFHISTIARNTSSIHSQAHIPQPTCNIIPHASIANLVQHLLSVTDPSCISPSISVHVCVPKPYSIQSSIPTACSKSKPQSNPAPHVGVLQ